MRLLSLCAFSVTLMISVATASSLVSTDGVSPAESPPILTATRQGSSWQIQLSVPGIMIARDDDGNVSRISLPGEPDVADADFEPLFSRIIGLQLDGDPTLEILAEDWQSLEISAPVSGTPPVAPVFSLSPREVMGGVALAVLGISPVRMDETTGELSLLRSASLRIHEHGQPLSARRPITETIASVLRPVIPNWNELGLDELVVRGTMLYVGANDGEVQSLLQPLLNWRKRKGYSVEFAGPTQIGNPLTTTNVKQYIQQRYNNANPPLEFVCLVGDGSGGFVVPPYLYHDPDDFTEDGVGDWDFTRLDGTDLLPDVAIGRFCFATTAPLLAQVNKTLRYEQTPAPRNNGSKPNWYKAGAVCGDYDHQSFSVSHVQTARWVRERMLDAGYVDSSIDTLYWTSYGNFIPVSVMNASINAGASLWCYRGWNRMGNYTVSDVAALNNVGHWPFMITPTCNTNNFDNYDLAEAFMTPTTSTQNPAGAIGVIAMSSGGTHTRLNNILMGGAVQGLLREGVHTTGATLMRAKLELRRNYPRASDSSQVAFFMGITSLLGDPAVDVFTDTPDTLLVNNPATLPVGTNALALTVTKPDGQPVDSARVNLTKGTEVFVGGYTDAQGRITLNFMTTTPDTLWVVASKHNYRSAITYSLVTWNASHVAPASASFVLDDDNSGTSQGNGDGRANPGETIELAVPLRNWGTTGVTGVTATISTDDPYIFPISDNFETYGNLAAGATEPPGDDFDFTVTSYAPHGHVAELILTVTDDAARTWVSLIPITLANGDLDYVSATLTGFGNGQLDPNESGQISLQLRNVGLRATAAGATAYLRSLNRAIIVTDSVGSFTAAAIGGLCNNQSNPFALTVSANAFPGERMRFQCLFPLSAGFCDTVEFTLTIGSIASTAPTPPDDYGYWAFDNTDLNYVQHPTYNWIEIDPNHGGPGQVLTINDDVDGADQTVIVNLPFAFRYYGEEYTQISVCSNGWLAMGADQAVHTEFRNYGIPSALGPSRMIAPFWDDLRTSQPMAASEEPSGRNRSLDEGGEDCQRALLITSLPYTDNGFTCNNRSDCGLQSRDVFYRYLIPAGGQRLVISLCGSQFDTYLSVWYPCCATQLAADNNGCGDGLGAQLIETYPEGAIYILVEGNGMACGNYTLHVTSAPLLPPGHICTYHDAANHRFIVEWSGVFKYTAGDDPVETFQCILYEPGYPRTPTGDGEIVFQYAEITNTVDVAQSNDFATVGIVNEDQTDGVEYSYYNRVSPDIPGAAALSAGRAIRFTTAKFPFSEPRAPEQLTIYRAGDATQLRWRAVTQDQNGNELPDVNYAIYRGVTSDFVPDDNSFLMSVSDTVAVDPLQAGGRFFYIVKAYVSEP